MSRSNIFSAADLIAVEAANGRIATIRKQLDLLKVHPHTISEYSVIAGQELLQFSEGGSQRWLLKCEACGLKRREPDSGESKYLCNRCDSVCF